MEILKCEKCGIDYDKPASYRDSNGVFFRWSLRFCDTCRREKERAALKRLPEIINALAND